MQMERNKMEEEFKSKLNQREITPSSHAWDRLDAMLNEADSRPQAEQAEQNTEPVVVRKLKWLYIAASFVGFALISTFFFQVWNNANPKSPTVVENTKENDTLENNNPAINLNDLLKKESPVNHAAPETQVAVSEPKTEQPVQQNKIRKTELPAIKQNNNQVAQVQNPEPKTQNPEQKIENQKTIITPQAHVDEQMASLDPKLQNPKTIKVDAGSLLSQVDGELELSFREKVIKTVGKKYQNVKVALANRNQE
jgi:hypothetical protein